MDAIGTIAELDYTIVGILARADQVALNGNVGRVVEDIDTGNLRVGCGPIAGDDVRGPGLGAAYRYLVDPPRGKYLEPCCR